MKCAGLVKRSRRHPVADLPCGNTASHPTPEGHLCGSCVRQKLHSVWRTMPEFERVKMRPANFESLSAEEQWDIDKRLGILDYVPSDLK